MGRLRLYSDEERKEVLRTRSLLRWTVCGERTNAIRKIKYDTNHDEIIAKKRQARALRKANNPNLVREEHLRQYGMTTTEWDDLFEKQNRRCACCGAEHHSGVNWHTDHDHDTGVVRGILCRSCNLALGIVKDDVDRLQGCMDYLNRHAPLKRMLQ